jgi:Protein of unknown function (DUF2510)
MTSGPPSAQPPPGWYPDPSGAPHQRYWDGARWTDHIAPPPPPAQEIAPPPAPQRSGSNSGLFWGSLVTAILFPLIGFILGIVLMARGEYALGVIGMVASLFFFALWASLLLAV